jgi:hypothetical protein
MGERCRVWKAREDRTSAQLSPEGRESSRRRELEKHLHDFGRAEPHEPRIDAKRFETVASDEGLNVL